MEQAQQNPQSQKQGNSTPQTNAVYTAIHIYPTPDGSDYRIEIVGGGQNGNRIDQQVARKILQLDGQARNPQVQQILAQSRQNPLAVIQNLLQGMMMPQMGGFPGMGGGMMPGGGMPPQMGGGFPH